MHTPLHPKIDPEVAVQVREYLVLYLDDVRQAPLAPSTKRTYSLHAENFVRWIEGDFEPGVLNKRKPENQREQSTARVPSPEVLEGPPRERPEPPRTGRMI